MVTDKCNQVYECTAGACTGSNPVTCTASDPCHVAGTCDPTSGSCSNPAATDGTSCNDGNACTRSDSCHAGACTGSNPVTCTALDTCHVAGVCNPANGTCSNRIAPDGTSCGTDSGGLPLVCMAGACAPPTPCAPNQTLCKGVCANTLSDPNNCGSCGQPCAAGASCVAGACLSAAVMASCGLPTGSMSVLVSSDGVTAYVPNGSWGGLATGIQRLVLEGGIVSAQTIQTPTVVNSCASNWVTGETVCTSNGTDVYLIHGSAITGTLTSGATGEMSFSGGVCQNCGVAIDATTNKAVLEVGLANPGGPYAGGYQFLDLSSNVFDPPIPAATDPLQTPGQSQRITENISVDSARHLVLSPNEFGDYQIMQFGASIASFNNSQFPPLIPNGANLPQFDSAAEDCTTGIALATVEVGGGITLVDLTQAVFTPGSPSGTWTAPFSTQVLTGLPLAISPVVEMTGISVAPGSHLALVTNEYYGGTFAVLRLPSTSGSGTPALVDWAATLIAKDPTGAVWNAALDPHTVTAYTSPRTGRAMGFVANSTGSFLGPPTFTALIDLQGILDAPRLPGTNNVDPAYDLVGHGVLTFIPMPCSQATVNTDPLNCGTCGHVCPVEPNSHPTCSFSVCKVVCDAGTADCNNVQTDGCEAVLSTDPANCGACGNSCAAPNATGVCGGGQCSLKCNQGFSDCDGNASNGCETQGPCGSPSVSFSGPTSVVVGDTSTYVATATDPVPGRTLMFAWTALSGPGAVTFSAPNALTTTAEFFAPGTYVLQFEANDGFATTATSLSVNAVYVNRPPVVSVGPDQTLPAPTVTTTLSGTATDDGLPQSATLSATWSLVSGPVVVVMATPTRSGVTEPGPITASTAVTFSYPGTYVFQLAVSDSDLVGTATQTVTVGAPVAAGGSGGTPPTVALSAISDDQVITKPTPVLGTISEGSWVLERRLGGRDDVQTAWTVVASGAGAVTGGTLATFDPTLLLNGIYTLRLSATTSAGSTSTSFSVSVDGRMKVGNFTLAFTDLEVAVAGMPFTLTRIYDSRDKSKGDFGIGWKLGITDVRVEKSGKIGAYWEQQFIDLGVFAKFCLLPTRPATVTITFPGGRQYRFAPEASPQCQLQAPNASPDIVWVSSSDPTDPNIKLVAEGGTSVVAFDTGSGVQLQDANFNIWDPRKFALTIEDGSVWQIDQDLGVTQVTDVKGNTLKVTPTGILHSSGRQVTFARDPEGRITTITDPNGKSMTYAYDGSGDLASYNDRLSNVTQFAYAPNHYLDQIQDPLGRLPIRNEYDSLGRLLSSTDPTGHKVVYTPSLAANQEQVTDRLGHVTLYRYNDFGDVTRKTDATGAVWNYTFDIRGNKLSETDPLGRTKTTTYNSANKPLTETDALGNVTTNTYDAFEYVVTTTDPLGHVTAPGVGINRPHATDALGNTTSYTYDFWGRWVGMPLTETDPLGNVTTNNYDDAGHLIQRTDALGNTTSFTYDANGNKTSDSTNRTNFDGSGASLVTTYAYDAIGHPLRTVKIQPGYATGPTRSTTYTPTGKQATTTDEDGRVTSYAYDPLDRLVATTRPDGTTVTQTYDAENHRASSTDAAGNTTLYAYDAVGRLIRTTYADGSSSSTAYDGAGQAIETIDERGHVQWAAYDAAGRRTSTTDATGAVTRYAYDAAGNQVSMTDPLGHTTSYAYDADNRLVATTYADGTAESMLYDPDGRTVAKVDTLGRSTDYGYDRLGRLVKITDALGDVTQYTYDETGAKTSQQDANRHTTVFRYDFVTNVETTRTLPDGVSETRSDDSAGQVMSRKDFAGQTTLYTYDPMGRVLTRTYPDSSVVSFTYTPTGQRATATDARATTSYGYDSRNRLVKLTYPDGRVLAYAYDAHGNRTALTAKIGAQSLTTTTAYDAANRPNQVTDPLGRVFAVTYDAAGNRTQLQDPNTTSTAYAYDARNRLTNLTTVQTTPGSPPLTTQSYAYTLDLAGRRTGVSEADLTTRTYAYDGIDRLTSEAVTGSLSYAKTFAYDPVGNRSTQTTTGSGAASVSYAYDTRDRLTTENATTYAYDANGNVTSKSGEATYAWDFENRLTSAAMNAGAVVSHTYDVDGNRVQTTLTPQTKSTTPLSCQGNSAVFARGDLGTQGNWQGAYGSDGQYISGESASPPAYASVSFSGATSFTWVNATSDTRALMQPPPGTSRIASTYESSTSETLHVVVTDNNVHTVAFYMLDFERLGLSQTVTAQTPSGTVLDAPRSFNGPTLWNGVWVVYTICGSVDFVFTNVSGPDAVVSGVFFGPPPEPPRR